MKSLLIPFRDVNLADRTFAFRRPGVPEALQHSIDHFGILVPLLLRGQTGAWQIVSGHRRAAAALTAGIESLPAFTLTPESLPHRESLLRLLEENRFGPPFSPFEAGTLLARFRDLAGMDLATLEREIGPRLGIPRGRVALERLLALPGLEEELLEDPGMKDGILPLLTALPPSTRLRLWKHWIQPHRPTLQKTREAVEWLLDLAARRRLSPDEILAHPPLREALEGGSPFLDSLRTLRYPTRTRTEEAFRKANRDLPKGLMASIPAPHEGDTVTFQFAARSPEDVNALLEELLQEDAAIRAVFQSLCDPDSPDVSSSSPGAKKTP
ncbi:MAG: ParB/RepB/Spo0J family partition protein [Planctomycetota bacterium]|jgi:ParB-like chromosome segregation protein Spo0J